MSKTPHILCIGSALWDIIGRCADPMALGDDRPGRITRIPGGVALNIALALVARGLQPSVLSYVGSDPQGDELCAACTEAGLDMSLVMRGTEHPTDRYMAIEGQNGLIAAIADAHSLEAVGGAILDPIPTNFQGVAVLDGNLTTALLQDISVSPLLARADLRVAPASPGKAERLAPLIKAGRATVYVNVIEAELLTGKVLSSASEAAMALADQGAARAIVTDGARVCADIRDGRLIQVQPPEVTAKRITGAGDTFMAAHLAAELNGQDPETALAQAAQAAASFVAGEDL